MADLKIITIYNFIYKSNTKRNLKLSSGNIGRHF